MNRILDFFPVRFNVAVCLFFACFISYMLRTNISITLLAMVESENGTEIVNNYGTQYPWSRQEQAQILGGFFWGYLISNLLGGVLAERFGGRNVVGLSLLISGLINCSMPLLLKFFPSFWTLMIGRVLLGVFGGTVFPALHNLVSFWAPPNEKSRFVSALLGGAMGNVVNWMMLGVLIENFGWSLGFYVPSIFTFVFVILWFFIVSDSPSTHPRISQIEMEMINESIGENLSAHKSLPPIKGLLTSIPFYALMVLHYGSLWGLYFLQTAAPMFMKEVLKFNLSKAGYFSSLPPLARLLSGFAFGAIGDQIRKKQVLDVTLIRKSFCIFSHIIPGLLLLTISYVATIDDYLCVAVVTLSMGFNGAATLTNLVNSQDLAPNFAGTLYGVINFVGTTTGFISPLIVAHFTTDENSTISEWKYVFWIGATAYIAPSIIFAVFGSGKVQKWNTIVKKENPQKEF